MHFASVCFLERFLSPFFLFQFHSVKFHQCLINDRSFIIFLRKSKIMEEEGKGMKNRAKLRWTKWRLKINKTHRLFEGVRDFSRRWREYNWRALKWKDWWRVLDICTLAAKRQCKIFRDSLMFCYGSCSSLAQTLIDRLVDQRRDHPTGRTKGKRRNSREFERFVCILWWEWNWK